jgi:alcohol dehydrogenase (cytochrome c)
VKSLVTIALAVLLVVSVYAQAQRGNGQNFAGAKLTEHPTTSWPTNGGNLFNQRYSPLTAINRENVAQLKGVWRARLNGSGTAPQYSGFATPLVVEGVAYNCTAANDVFSVSLYGGYFVCQYEA